MDTTLDYHGTTEYAEAIKLADELAFLITAGTFTKITEKHWEACLIIRSEQIQQAFKETYEQ